jgi:hypothetical protein
MGFDAELEAADLAAIAAYHAKDDAAHTKASAEMLRLEKVERSLLKAICRQRPTGRDEAITQAIVGAHIALLIAEGCRTRKWAGRANAALLSALCVLSEAEPSATPGEVRRRYFERPVKRILGDAA